MAEPNSAGWVQDVRSPGAVSKSGGGSAQNTLRRVREPSGSGDIRLPETRLARVFPESGWSDGAWRLFSDRRAGADPRRTPCGECGSLPGAGISDYLRQG